MTTAIILHAPRGVLIGYNRDEILLGLVLHQIQYFGFGGRVELDDSFTGEDAAEEVFDLTNNPGRDSERYGKDLHLLRSVSVGDVIKVGTDLFVCMSMGWKKLGSLDAAGDIKEFVCLMGTEAGNKFFTRHVLGTNPRYLHDGQMAFWVIGYADTVTQAQAILYGC